MKRTLSKTELLAFATTQILTTKPDGQHTATGFFVNYSESKSSTSDKILLVTNKHVIRDAKEMSLVVNTFNESKGTVISQVINISKFMPLWSEHPNPVVDLAMFPIAAVQAILGKMGIDANWKFFSVHKSDIASNTEISSLSLLEDVYMVGYPDGLRDKANNTPIFRRGVIASLPFLNYEGEPIFLADMAVFPGSSGSPVFVIQKGVHSDGEGLYFQDLKDAEPKLVGIAFGTYTHTSRGDVVRAEIEETKAQRALVDVPNNIGAIVKSHCLLQMVEAFLAPRKNTP